LLAVSNGKTATVFAKGKSSVFHVGSGDLPRAAYIQPRCANGDHPRKIRFAEHRPEGWLAHLVSLWRPENGHRPGKLDGGPDLQWPN
jgi:hypothetical protein